MRANELAELSAFVAIADELNFRRAAARLKLTPSTLSHSLRSLEQRLGVRLVNRTTRTVALTEAGLTLRDEVGPAFGRIEAAVEKLNAYRERPRGVVRLNAPRSAATIVLAPRLAEFTRRYPDVVLELKTDEGFVDIVREGYDAGIRLYENVDRDMVAVKVSRGIRPAVVASAAYLAEHPAPLHPRDLTSHRCVGRRPAGASALLRWWFDNDGERISVAVEGPLIFDSDDLMRGAAIDGIGLAFLGEPDVAAEIADGRLIRVLQDWCQAEAEYFIYYPRSRQPSASLSALVETLRA